jgi:large subunit ribosomal protein L21
MYAVIATGGKQYRVSEGDIIYVEKLDQEPDSTVTFDVLMAGDGKTVKIGKPTLKDVTVEGKVLSQVKGEKLIVYKYKEKKAYHRTIGHRQKYTKVEITGISK